jgi:ubiquinone/menaquinone biosynthesis C-methylase UbiE
MPRMKSLAFVLAAALALGGVGGNLTVRHLDARDRPAQAERLATVLHVGPGATVAEIGAGGGAMAVEMARVVGPGGRVFATELKETQLEDIRRAAGDAGLTNITVLKAGEHDSNLQPGCCDAVYMQRVYHHLTDPAAVVASIARALKPTGLFAVMDFEPGGFSNGPAPEGVPDRGGHGVPKQRLLSEMKAYGFETVGGIEDVGDRLYLAVFRPVPVPTVR